MVEKITFESFDCFNRDGFAEALKNRIMFENPISSEGFVLSLNAEFGRGKTTFVNMMQAYLEEEGFKTFSINAWESDFMEDPFVPVVSSLVDKLPDANGSLKKACKAAIGAIAFNLDNIAQVSTLGLLKIKEAAKEVSDEMQKDDLVKYGGSYYSAYEEKLLAFNALKKELAKYIRKECKEKPLVIFVDELDRAKPDYAIKFLEAIKHIFSIEGVVFILSVNKKQLRSSAKVLFGTDLDFQSYYHRFVSAEIDLPDIVSMDYKKFTERLFEEYISTLDYKTVIDHNIGGTLEVISYILESFRFTPRSCHLFFKSFRYLILNEEDVAKQTSYEWIIAAGFLLALKVMGEDYLKLAVEDSRREEFDKLLLDTFDLDGRLGSYCYYSFSSSSTNERNYKTVKFLIARTMLGRSERALVVDSDNQQIKERLNGYADTFSRRGSVDERESSIFQLIAPSIMDIGKLLDVY